MNAILTPIQASLRKLSSLCALRGSEPELKDHFGLSIILSKLSHESVETILFHFGEGWVWFSLSRNFNVYTLKVTC